MPETFDFDVRAHPTGQKNFRTLDAQFGDGYSQSAADGINTEFQSWTISCRGLIAPDCIVATDIAEVMAFLDSHGGWKSFLWTPPIGTESLYQSRNYGIETDHDVITINATFVQVYR